MISKRHVLIHVVVKLASIEHYNTIINSRKTEQQSVMNVFIETNKTKTEDSDGNFHNHYAWHGKRQI